MNYLGLELNLITLLHSLPNTWFENIVDRFTLQKIANYITTTLKDDSVTKIHKDMTVRLLEISGGGYIRINISISTHYYSFMIGKEELEVQKHSLNDLDSWVKHIDHYRITKGNLKILSLENEKRM